MNFSLRFNNFGNISWGQIISRCQRDLECLSIDGNWREKDEFEAFFKELGELKKLKVLNVNIFIQDRFTNLSSL